MRYCFNHNFNILQQSSEIFQDFSKTTPRLKFENKLGNKKLLLAGNNAKVSAVRRGKNLTCKVSKDYTSNSILVGNS